MAWLRRLFGGGNPSPPGSLTTPVAATATTSDGEFCIEVVGESHYQQALEKIAGGRTKDGVDITTVAVLAPEPRNRHDRNAVQVLISGKVVGYLSRENAEILQPRILQLQKQTGGGVACRARIVGGWDRGRGDRGHFGVRLYLDPADFGLEEDELDGDWE